jgi:hypothetical protein
MWGMCGLTCDSPDGRQVCRHEVRPDPHEAQRVPEHTGLQCRIRAHLCDDGRVHAGEDHGQPAPAEAPGADPLGPRMVTVGRREDGGQFGGLPG